jgi:hypothetical protein
MFIHSSEGVHLARVFQVLHEGELLAADTATRQAILTSNERTKRFLASQARQEFVHAQIFNGAAAWLAPRQRRLAPAVLKPLTQYRALLNECLIAARLDASMVGQQVILEGLGEAVLQRLCAGLVRRGSGLTALGRRVLREEHAHRQFGAAQLLAGSSAHAPGVEALRHYADEFLLIVTDLVRGMEDVLDALGEDPKSCLQDFYANLPGWLVHDDFRCHPGL